MYRGLDPSQVIVRPDGVQIGDRFVPTDDSKAMLLNFSPDLSGTAEVISAVDVFNGTVPKKKLDGKIVFIGATATTLGDVKTAPVNKSSDLPGVMFHANAANTILTGTYLEPVPDSQTILWVAAITAIVGIAVLLLPLWASIIITLLVGLAYVGVRVHAVQQRARDELRVPVVGRALRVHRWSRVCATSVRRASAGASPRCSRSTCPRPSRNGWSKKTAPSSAVEGERLEMTVLFCDLRGFTALSENLEPAIVRVMLNHYYDRVTDIVLAMDGTLMKYVGDEVFAVWGAPLPSDDHPQRALECAIAIQELTPDLNRELVEQGAPEVSFGIGLNTGDAVAAHFGGGRRRQYDVVGDTVNVGARLCSAAGRGEIILSDAVLTSRHVAAARRAGGTRSSSRV